MGPAWRLLSETTGKTVVARLTIAGGFWSRLAGLQFRRPLPSDAGLLLVPCNSVHTCFVRFAVDVVFPGRQWPCAGHPPESPPLAAGMGTAEEPRGTGGNRGLGRLAAR